METAEPDQPEATGGAERAAAVLVLNHRAFLGYLERRVGSREAAEDILQDAFVRNLRHIDFLPEEALVPWFYRVLRNAVIDRSRRRAAADRALDAFARELGPAQTPPPELESEICACVGRLAGTLKADYAEILHAVDVDGLAVKDYARARGLSSSNAGVRLFRARQALRAQVVRSCGTCAEHGCIDCTCGTTCR
jgi:RNA polymerase sigma-70 factor (ECF subfamily)